MFDWLKRLVGRRPSVSVREADVGEAGAGEAGAGGGFVHFAGQVTEAMDAQKVARLQKEAVPGAVPPFGTWVEIQLPWDKPELFLGFTYVDRDAGLSAKGGPVGDPNLVQAPTHTVRLPLPLPFRVLPPEEQQRRDLPTQPPWLHVYGPQPDPEAPWRKDAYLSPLLLDGFPDDLPVLFYGKAEDAWHMEEMWVRLQAYDAKERLYEGELLNQPHHLRRVNKGERVRLRVAPGAPRPVYVGDVEAANLREFDARCEGCGFDMLLEPARDLQARQFANVPADEAMLAFTTRCLRCGGAMLVNRRDAMDLV